MPSSGDCGGTTGIEDVTSLEVGGAVSLLLSVLLLLSVDSVGKLEDGVSLDEELVISDDSVDEVSCELLESVEVDGVD